MTDFERVNLRLECLRLAKEIKGSTILYDLALKPEGMNMEQVIALHKAEKFMVYDSRKEGIRMPKVVTSHDISDIADEIYAYCIGEVQEKDVD